MACLKMPESAKLIECCLHETMRNLDWCEKNCERYYRCDTAAAAIDDEKEKEEAKPFIWTPIKLTDKATGRSVHITIFERELYLSGVLTFEDFWNGEHLPESQEEPESNERNEE